VSYKHPKVKKGLIEERDYQTNIAEVCSKRSTLVVVPTGLGKTVIALMVLADRLEQGKVLFLAPTRPLVEQHASFLKKALVFEEDGQGDESSGDGSGITLFTGNVPPKKRSELFAASQIIVSTPQVIENDLISGRIHLKDVSIIIFDEAHRGVGNYAYVFIAERYRSDRPYGDQLTLGITASPGSNADKILEVCENLGMMGVEIRSEYDADVYPYVQKVNITWIEVELPKQVKRIRDLLNELYVEYLKKLQRWGLLNQTTMVSKKMLLDTQKRIQGRIFASKDPPKSLFQAASLQSGCMKLNHGMELAETQGVYALREYFDRLDSEAHARGGGRAAKVLLTDERVRMAIRLTRKEESEHPKLKKVIDIVRKELRGNSTSRIIVFTHYRDTSEMVTAALEKENGIRPVRFVGQASRGEDKGMSQKLQVETIRAFEEGEYNVLVATSVAEEGLDIPSTDLVVFYEPVPSEIRTIQRRGRTGRKHAGKVVILITKGTRDNAYYWASKNKEKNMQKELRNLRKVLKENIDVDQSVEERNRRQRSIREQVQGVEKDNVRASDSSSSSLSSPYTPHPPSPGQEEDQDNAGEYEIPSIKKGQTHIFDFRETDLNRQVSGQVAGPEAEGTDEALKIKARNWNVGEGTILVDTRELNSSVVKELSRMGYTITSEQLDVGDYILSDRLGIERKASEDFVSSLKDGRLFQQLGWLKKSFVRPVVILEGKGLFDLGGMNPASIYGALASIVTDFGIPIIHTRDQKETAIMISSISKREYAEARAQATRVDIGAGLIKERQHFIIEGLPNVSAVLARRLLDHFGSVRAVLNASLEELMEVKGVGKKIAQEIIRVMDEGYLRKKEEI